MPDPTAKKFNPSNNELVSEIKDAAEQLINVINKLPATTAYRRKTALTLVEAASMFAVKAVFYDDDDERTEA
tara:strand:+ start:253 stop:468 length:216 start_codon:yes stop_codon:yes gene_type:complete